MGLAADNPHSPGLDPADARQLDRLLQRHRARPKKSFGQNFLIDAGLRDRVLEEAGIEPTDEVLEIGAGAGTLTTGLAARCRRLVAVELDQAMLRILREVAGGHANLEVVAGDILKLDTQALFPAGGEVVVGNIPYYLDRCPAAQAAGAAMAAAAAVPGRAEGGCRALVCGDRGQPLQRCSAGLCSAATGADAAEDRLPAGTAGRFGAGRARGPEAPRRRRPRFEPLLPAGRSGVSAAAKAAWRHPRPDRGRQRSGGGGAVARDRSGTSQAAGNARPARVGEGQP